MPKTTPLPTEVRRRVQRALRTRSFRAALRSNTGAIDLASIMVGVIVIGVIAGIIAATVFAVIPWSQNSAAKQSLDAVRTAEGVAFVMTDKYQTVDQLVALGYLQAPSGSTVAEGLAGGSGTGVRGPVLAVTVPSGGIQISLNADGSCYIAAARSATGDIFISTSKNPGSEEYVAGVTDTDWCTPVEPLVSSMGGATVGEPLAGLKPQITTGTNLPNGYTGNAYTVTLAANNAPTSWTIASGALPAGLTLDSGTGAIIGTPASTAAAAFQVIASNSNGSYTRSFRISVSIGPGNGIVSAVAGSGIATDTDGTGLAAAYNHPMAIASYGNGNLYSVSRDQMNLRMTTPAGVVTTVTRGGYGYLDGPVATAKLYNPKALAVGSDGAVYIADFTNNKVRKVFNGFVSTLATVNQPTGVAVDEAGNVYAISRSQILMISAAGVVTPLTNGINPIKNIDGDFATARSYPALALAVSAAGTVYFTDGSNIRQIDSDRKVTTVSVKDANGLTVSPSGRVITLGADGNVYGATSLAVWKVTPEGTYSVVAGSTAGSSNGVGINAKFTGIAGITVHTNGKLYVIDQSLFNVRVIQ